MEYLFGAIDKSGNLVSPEIATKAAYQCPGCEKPVHLKRGKVRRPHFAHNPGSDCAHYNGGGEGALHLAAKHRLAQCLRDRVPLDIHAMYECSHSCLLHKVDYRHAEHVNIEQQLEGRCRADVGVLSKDGLLYIFEVLHTHVTTTMRPEPWFEFKATDILTWDCKTFLQCQRLRAECPNCVAERAARDVKRLQAEQEARKAKERIANETVRRFFSPGIVAELRTQARVAKQAEAYAVYMTKRNTSSRSACEYETATRPADAEKIIADAATSLLLRYMSFVMSLPDVFTVARFGWWNNLRAAGRDMRVAMMCSVCDELNVVDCVTDEQRQALASYASLLTGVSSHGIRS